MRNFDRDPGSKFEREMRVAEYNVKLQVRSS